MCCRTLSVVFLVLLGVLRKGETSDLDAFYPFGKHTGDAKLQAQGGAEEDHAWVNLSTPVVFYGEAHEGLYVNLDGVISFEQPAPPFSKHVTSKKSTQFPAHFKVLAPFYTHVVGTSRESGGVFFRETGDKAVLARATKEVRAGFANANTFLGYSVFIATWVNITYREERNGKTNSFQVVLVSDGIKTFAIFHYDKPLILRRAERKNGKIGFKEPFGKTGFSFGDGLREFLLPGSGTRKVHLLNRFTNTNRPGKWMYMIGSRQVPHLNIVSAIIRLPPSKNGDSGHKGCYLLVNLPSSGNLIRHNVTTAEDCATKCGISSFTLALVHHIDGCMCAEEKILKSSYKQWNMQGKCEGKHLFTVYKTDDVMMGDDSGPYDLTNSNECGYDRTKCSKNAACVKLSAYCCACDDGYYGNGKSCLPDGKNVHMVGVFAGKMNGVTFEDVKFSVFSDFKSRTSHVSLDSVSPFVGWPLLFVFPIATSPGFLFAMPGSSVDNGFSMLGNAFLRRTKVSFETGESCFIRERFMGMDENGFINFKTEISGNAPAFNQSSTITAEDYVHSYRYDRLGVFSGFYQTSFFVADRKYKISVVEALEFNEERACLNIADRFKMAVSQQRSRFEEENGILRFAQKTEMIDGDVKLCGQRNQHCGRHAKCIVKEGIEFCGCNIGFNGNGYSCDDVDECLLSIHECSENALCLNNAGSYSCTCRKGYQGDGRNCRLVNVDGLCGVERLKCAKHATCFVTNNGVGSCECNIGFHQSGDLCLDVDECSLDIHNCSLYSACWNTAGSYQCVCSKGYEGDGKICHISGRGSVGSGDACSVDGEQCGAHEECVDGFCRCISGFLSDGSICRDANECELGIHKCDKNALCTNNVGSFVCSCHDGYVGDGFKCSLDTQATRPLSGCNGVDCHDDAECDRTEEVPVCKCNKGYQGDGLSCEDINECDTGEDHSSCHGNAICYNSPGSYRCVCRPGYKGDGLQCSAIDPCKDMECGANAHCVLKDGSPVCQCPVGYYKKGGNCEDINECDTGEHHSSCHGNAICYNSPGSYRCVCRPGYKGDGLQCSAIDPCKDVECGANAHCVLKEGSPVCQCLVGYYKKGKSCEDYNECKVDRTACHKNAKCINTVGSYRCFCSPGYYGNGFSCKSDGTCSGTKCHRNAKCVESNGARRCQCDSGFDGSGRVCSDYNECKVDRTACHKNAKCINTVGSYRCFCSPGYYGNGFSCKSDGTCSGSKCHRNAKCVESNGARRCQCDSGFDGSGRVCSDLNECANSTLRCPEFSRCINTLGSYKCQCNSGYQWNGFECQFVCYRCLNGGTCTETGCLCREGYSGDRCQWAGNEFLMFTQGSTIQRSSLPPRQNTVGVLLETSRGLIVALDYDHKNKFIYYTDVSGKAIWRVKYNGTGVEKVIARGLSSPEGIAVDYVGGNIYWTDSMFDRIEVAKLNGKDRKVLFSTRLINPRSIVVHPEKGTMYWADWNRVSPKIEVANMDGGSRRLFVRQKMGLPNGLSIDRRKNELCWTDAKFGSISCANLDDGSAQVIYSSAGYPFGLTSFGQYLIWTDWTERNILQYDRQTFNLMPPIRRLRGTNGAFYDIKTVPSSQEIGLHQCSENNGGCTNLCLPRPGGRSCACPNGFHLVDQTDRVNSFAPGAARDIAGVGVTDAAPSSGQGTVNTTTQPQQTNSTQTAASGTRVQLPVKVCITRSEYLDSQNLP